MNGQNRGDLPHLLVTNTATTEPYTTPVTGRGPTLNFPPRNRQQHAQDLLQKLDAVKTVDQERNAERTAFGIDGHGGICLEFESSANFDLKFESLEKVNSGIELLGVKEIDNKKIATVFVPEGKLEQFEKRILAYREQETPSGKPKNQPLIDGISAINVAILEALWTDTLEVLPAAGDSICWEVWLRIVGSADETLSFFREQAGNIGLQVHDRISVFPDRAVLTAFGSKEQMAQSIALLNCIAELRRAKETADFFTQQSADQQADWVNTFLETLTPPSDESPAVCILDTGVNHAHPLLAPALHEADMHACDPAWGLHDHHDHGTEMAGMALYGDLTEILPATSPFQLQHQLESVKILPPRGQNPPHLYGAITQEGIARAEVAAPDRQRVCCMAVTTTDFRDRGQPSEWSASVDALCAGVDGGQQRLLIISAGNTELVDRHKYPDSNLTDAVHDPGQAWNALTVGAYTDKGVIDQTEFPDWYPVAPVGDLSPASCTSRIWGKPWPLKPEVVFEGGNMAINPGTGTADYVDSLSLLTTHRNMQTKPLVPSGDTSAATALAARMAARIQASYGEYWPETVRALMLHSADWTPAMLARVDASGMRNKQRVEHLLKCYGYGVPNLQSVLWSAQNSLTLISQDSLQPYDRVAGKMKTRDLNLHQIPWPKEVLQNLGDTQVEMRVTLSYFVEPNPARRGWVKKHRYMSHGLRFEVKTPTESVADFRRRINKAAREEESGDSYSGDSADWLLGPKLRSLGSVHHDRWQGTAAELAEREFVGVYPVIGWWRDRHQLGKWNQQARYSLVVTIKTPETEVDIYTPVENMISTVVMV